jgi:hypothetical protein
MQNSKADLPPNRGQGSIGGVTSGLTRPLAAEIVFPPFSAIRKVLIASKRYNINYNCPRIENRGRSTDW